MHPDPTQKPLDPEPTCRLRLRRHRSYKPVRDNPSSFEEVIILRLEQWWVDTDGRGEWREVPEEG